MDRNEYDEIIRSLARSAAKQDIINDDLRDFARQQREANQRQEITNERLTMAIERLDTTQARIETLLAYMIRTNPNGTAA
jgi:hypothetical protein